jgi:hypothetical protein
MTNFFENAENYGKKFIKTCLIGTAAIGISFVLFFVSLACFRLALLCWNILFGHGWGIK